jgi:membrane protein DedA with SNARE-associated domain
MFNQSIPALLDFAGRSGWLQSVAIILGTFVLEDAATVLAALRTNEGGLSVSLALGSLYVGIVLGDLGLYGLGRLAHRFAFLRRWFGPERAEMGRAWLDGHVFKVVLASRFLPGARLPTYTACGFLGCNLERFAIAAAFATLGWTSLLFTASRFAGHVILDHLGTWRWAGIIGLAITPVILGHAAARLRVGNRSGA